MYLEGDSCPSHAFDQKWLHDVKPSSGKSLREDSHKKDPCLVCDKLKQLRCSLLTAPPKKKTKRKKVCKDIMTTNFQLAARIRFSFEALILTCSFYLYREALCVEQPCNEAPPNVGEVRRFFESNTAQCCCMLKLSGLMSVHLFSLMSYSCLGWSV